MSATIVSFTFAGGSSDSGASGGQSTSGAGSAAPAAKTVKIGLAQMMQHPALDMCREAVKEAVTARMPGVTIVWDEQNANGDQSTMAQIASKYASEKVDVAVGIATPMAQALVNGLPTTPVVFTAVTDPVGAGLTASMDKGDAFVTGASDLIPTADNVALFKEIAGIKTLGYIYCNAEANSEFELGNVTAGAKAAGMQLVTQTVNTTADVRQAAQALVGRVDGLYLSTDNTVFSAIDGLIEVFRQAKKPIFAGDATGVMQGGVMIASGVTYHKLGLATGEIVADILGGKKCSDIPVKVANPSVAGEMDFLVDLDAAKNCGITIAQKYINQANMIFENGKLTQK
jgi:putative ABC transport system substrate-binding protein